ncbi:MAG TPA: hypothetical protein VLU46_10255 [Thermoanaerobaculia bacterium]|nr:hypothetical protein [Thermoanaerobaculia bacterium]
MAISLMQKIRLMLRGWSRRREEKEQEFLRKNAGWGVAAGFSPPTDALKRAATPAIDLDGLHAAYLDGSGQIAYYLDVESGEVVEHRDAVQVDAARFKRVPAASNTDVAERRAFIETLEPSATRDLLMKSVNTGAFRTALASDRSAERGWYNFRNDRAIAAIEAWLKKLGLR